MAIFIAITCLAIMTKMTKMAIIAVMEYYELALNMDMKMVCKLE